MWMFRVQTDPGVGLWNFMHFAVPFTKSFLLWILWHSIKFCILPYFLFNHVTFPLKAFSRWRWDVFGVSTFCPWNHLALHSQRIGKRVGTYPEIPSQNSVFIYITFIFVFGSVFVSVHGITYVAVLSLHYIYSQCIGKILYFFGPRYIEKWWQWTTEKWCHPPFASTLPAEVKKEDSAEMRGLHL